MIKIPFSPPDIGNREAQNVLDALQSGWITTGPKTKEFERRIAEYCGTPKAVCLNSATAGLELVLRILGVGEGDEVITSAYTYTASASVIAHVGAKIVLCDVASDSYEMDYDKLAQLITDRTKVIIPVDIGGILCAYDKIFSIIKSRRFVAANDLQAKIGRIAVLADAAHSFGAVRDGKKSGTFADFTSFSFHAVKNLTTAEGGAVVWNGALGLYDDELYRQFMLWSLHGQSKDALAKTAVGAWEYDIKLLGQKCNMTDIAAAIGLAQLDRYGNLLAVRRQLIGHYDAAFEGRGIKGAAHFCDTSRSSGHLYLTQTEGLDEQKRNAVIVALAEDGIASNVHYKPLPMHTAYKNLGFDIADFPNAYKQYSREITLPLHTLLSAEEVDYVAERFIAAADKVRGNDGK